MHSAPKFTPRDADRLAAMAVLWITAGLVIVGVLLLA